MVADAVERLGAQVERRQDHVGAPHGVVVPLGHVGAQRVLAGVAAGAVAAVVAEGDGLGERDVEPERGGDATGHLGHLERVGEAGALVVVREDEHLGLAGQPPEGGRVQDAVPVALEAGAPGVGWLLAAPVAGAARPGGAGGQAGLLGLLPILPGDPCRPARAGVRVAVSQHDALAQVAAHRGRPGSCPLAHVVVAHLGLQGTQRVCHRDVPAEPSSGNRIWTPREALRAAGSLDRPWPPSSTRAG